MVSQHIRPMSHSVPRGGGSAQLIYGRGRPSDIFGLKSFGESDISRSAKIFLDN